MIDQQGNITLNRASDLFVPIVRKDHDGNIVDISTSTLRFVAQNAFSLSPDVDPFNSTGRRLHFTPAHAADLIKPAPFVLQLTNPDGSEEVIWSGNISSTGFAVTA